MNTSRRAALPRLTRALGAHLTSPGLAITVGSALRLRQFVANRPLYTDEAYTSLNVLTRSYAGLLKPLDWDQNAPPLFLWCERLASSVLGSSEMALRSISLICGITALIAFRALAQQLLSPRAARFGIWTAALCPLLIRYSSEVKPYGPDVLAAILLCLATTHVLQQPERKSRWAALAVVTGLGLLASNPLVFVFAAAFAGLVVTPRVHASEAARGWLFGWAASMTALFVAQYLFVIRAATRFAFNREALRDTFLDPTVPALAARVRQALGETFLAIWQVDSTFEIPHVLLLILVLAALGAVYLYRRNGLPTIVLLLGPLVTVVATSAFGLYPLLTRTMLFEAPLTMIAVAAGVELLAQSAPQKLQRGAFAILVLVLLFPPAVTAWSQALHPPLIQPSRDLAAEFKRLATPDEAVYLSHWGRSPWAFYTTDWQAPDTARIRWLEAAIQPRVAGDHTVVRGEDAFQRTHEKRMELVQMLPPFAVIYASTLRKITPPPPGWAATEVRRIKNAARPSAWLFLVYGPPEYEAALRGALEAEHAQVSYTRGQGDARLLRVSFPSP